MNSREPYHIVDVTKPLDRLHQIETLDVISSLIERGYRAPALYLLEALSARLQCDDYMTRPDTTVRH